MRFIRILTLAVLAVPLMARAERPLVEYSSPLKDITLKSSVVKRDMDLLKKISPEFAQSYRVANSTMWYKEPNKLLLISKAGLLNVVYKINGNTKTLKAGFFTKRWDVTHTPAERQTALTVGLITPAWVDLVDVTYKGKQKVDGRDVEVYQAKYREGNPLTFYRLYVDPQRKVLLRLDQCWPGGNLKVAYRFLDPASTKGVWVPTRIEVLTPEGKQGALTKIYEVKVNTGLSDDLFAL